MFRQLPPDRNLGLVVDFLHVDKSLVWPGDCHAKDFPPAFDYRSDYGPEQTGEVENLLKFLPLFAEVDGVSILRVLLKHATAVCIAAHVGANYRGVDAGWGRTTASMIPNPRSIGVIAIFDNYSER